MRFKAKITVTEIPDRQLVTRSEESIEFGFFSSSVLKYNVTSNDLTLLSS